MKLFPYSQGGHEHTFFQAGVRFFSNVYEVAYIASRDLEANTGPSNAKSSSSQKCKLFELHMSFMSCALYHSLTVYPSRCAGVSTTIKADFFIGTKKIHQHFSYLSGSHGFCSFQ